MVHINPIAFLNIMSLVTMILCPLSQNFTQICSKTLFVFTIMCYNILNTIVRVRFSAKRHENLTFAKPSNYGRT